MYTGAQLSQDLDIRVRQTNAGAYLSPARKNYVVGKAVTDMLEERYRSISKQSSVDEISKLIKTYQPFTPYNEQVLTKPLHISTIVNTTGNIYQVTFDRPHNFDFVNFPNIDITFSGVEGGTYTDLNGNTYTASIPATNITTSCLITVAGLSGTYTLNTGEISGDYWLSEYYHLLTTSVECLKNQNVNILGVKIGTKCTITVGTNNIRTGERLRFSGFNGLTGLTGYKYVKLSGERKFVVYDDVNLTVATVVTGTWTSGGVIERVHNEYCEPLLSDQKISAYGATEHFPLFEINDDRLRCYTSDVNSNPYITNIKYYVDYIVRQAQINIEDTTTDLLQMYNQNMCNEIIERAALIWFTINTATEDVQITTVLP